MRESGGECVTERQKVSKFFYLRKFHHQMPIRIGSRRFLSLSLFLCHFFRSALSAVVVATAAVTIYYMYVYVRKTVCVQKSRSL